MTAATSILHQLPRPSAALRDVPLLVLVAHPDDEVLGAGSRLPYLGGAHIVYVTDGAPRDMSDAARAGYASAAAYGEARRCEAEAALALLGVESHRIRRLGLMDQEVAFAMSDLNETCLRLIETLRPAAILTHAYEGGHPDHDAVALAVHLACRRHGRDWPELIEFAGYHDPDGTGRIATCEFLTAPASAVSVWLKPPERAQKRRALACFRTQRRVLRMFRADRERFRAAPLYQFGRPPHAWRPFYERFVQHLDGQRWCRLAQETLARYDMAGPV
jgi:LmbE family N-acetylglucosaminyl deacetylase